MRFASIFTLMTLTIVSLPGVASAETANRSCGDSARLETQPRMRAASVLLSKAKGELQNAASDKGGHRAKAIEHVNLALKEVREGIGFDNAHPGAIAGDDAVELDAQPRMKIALDLLRDARSELEKAEHDKGGHRAKAIVETEAAIAQVKAGIQFDNQH